ncbi:unnamed protein product [Thelazia callipaeda]|uniref:Leucine-rich repeat-containing protein 56 n=1 Tax=Thelazia callipaeda TaxID=103827 RepID=A0A158RCT8_THECL|nr:unnamed protein product [Thelazia callipaeda]
MDNEESQNVVEEKQQTLNSSVVNIDESSDVFNQTCVDLSNKNMQRLPNIRKNYPLMREINISHNRLKFVNNLSKFTACQKIDTSFNAIERFSCFLPLASVLKYLNISHNVVSNCNNLVALTQLVWLDMSYNHIQALPTLDRLENLTYLNISSNRLCILPNLHRLLSLKTLIVHDNKISTLSNVGRTIPLYLQDLDIGANVIIDLREAQNLSCLRSIQSLVFEKNPCVDLEGRTFSYRPYLYSCCLERLQIIDGQELSETEIIKGIHFVILDELKREELHTQAKVRRMGTHAELCAYLEKNCPEDYHHSFSHDDSRLMKVLKKRREYVSRLKDDATSDESMANTASPYREWLHKSASSVLNSSKLSLHCSQQKENCAPLDLNHLVSQPTGSTATPPTSATSNISSPFLSISAPSFSHSTPVRSCIQLVFRFALLFLRLLIFIKQKNSLQVPAVPKLPTPGLNRYITHKQCEEISFVSACKSQYSEKEKAAVLTIESWWRNMQFRRMSELPFLKKRLELCEKKLEEYKGIMEKLNRQCNYLARTLEDVQNTMKQRIEKVTEACNETRELVINKLLPVPSELNYIRQSQDEIMLDWVNHQMQEEPTGYQIFVNGMLCGTVRGHRKKVIIKDLNPGIKSEIRIVSLYHQFSGVPSKDLVVPPFDQEPNG